MGGGQHAELPSLVMSVSAGCFPPFKAVVMLCFSEQCRVNRTMPAFKAQPLINFLHFVHGDKEPRVLNV